MYFVKPNAKCCGWLIQLETAGRRSSQTSWRHGYTQIESSHSPRDVALYFNVDSKGVVIDVSRTGTVNYDTIEGLKNGLLISNKYETCCLEFKPKKIIVFCNSSPNRSSLSADRWKEFIINDHNELKHDNMILCNVDEVSSIDPRDNSWYYEPPPRFPILSETFDYRQFMHQHGYIQEFTEVPRG